MQAKECLSTSFLKYRNNNIEYRVNFKNMEGLKIKMKKMLFFSSLDFLIDRFEDQRLINESVQFKTIIEIM